MFGLSGMSLGEETQPSKSAQPTWVPEGSIYIDVPGQAPVAVAKSSSKAVYIAALVGGIGLLALILGRKKR